MGHLCVIDYGQNQTEMFRISQNREEKEMLEVVIFVLLAMSVLLKTAGDAASYSNMKRQQKERWRQACEDTKRNYERIAKENDFYWRASEDSTGMFFPDRRRHYDGTPR